MSMGFFIISMLAFEVFWLILFCVFNDMFGIYSKLTKACGLLFAITPIAFFFAFLIWGSK